MQENGAKSQHASREERILAFWKERGIFEKSLAKRSPKGEFVFYEGPPTANGRPGIHHIEARSFKDALPRFKTMQGFHVRRKAGWDTHGLPVELQVEKELGFKSKKDIEDFGIAEFNKKCKESVFQYIDEWRKLSERMGYWTDYDDAYFTFDNSYIESLWNIVGKIDAQNLLYKDYRVTPWCTRCGTTLSSHELAQGYQDVKDLSVTAKFKISSAGKGFVEVLGSPSPGRPDHQKSFSGFAYLLAWTTTPWTLPGNVALAVGESIDYVYAKVGEEILILAEARLSILPEGYEIIKKVKGKELVGISYEPLYTFLKPNEKSYKVYAADFVNTEDGTGIVHTAVMYGADDFALGTKEGLPKYHLVREDGTYKEECGFLAGKQVKTEETDVEIIKDLAHRALLFKKEKHEHSYPHCWRCKTPLIYYARDSWYIGMSKLRDVLVKENEKINWEPAHIKDGRFGEWLREVKDWAISRERYWGTPLPVWMSEDGSEKLIVDSIETLRKHTKKSDNKYFLMRHGRTVANDKGVLDLATNHPLSTEGVANVEARIKQMKKDGFAPDIIISSPFKRTRETAEKVAEGLSFPRNEIIYDDRIVEWCISQDLDGENLEKIFDRINKESSNDHYRFVLPRGESYADVVARMGGFIYDLESKYKNKTILIISHAGPLKALSIVSDIIDVNKIDEFHKHFLKFDNAEVRAFDFTALPHNDRFEPDLHKPYIDEVELVKNSKTLKRVKEVMDVWFDSGAMPFAQDHYPFDFAHGKPFENKKLSYPADFIAEAIDQTRGWFYTLHAVGALMGRGRAYKNVICLGHLLDKDGKKMSKSLGNVLDPWEQMDKWGVDALRLWMYSVNQPGESKNYDEKTVDEVNKKFFNLVSNVLSFYELYRDKSLENNARPQSKNVLDRWILVKLEMLIEDITKNLENYKLLEPVRSLRDFIDDLSTWYLQLSRDRFREGDVGAKQTLYFVLKTLAKILAPFAPFFAEDLYQKLRAENDLESVHLEDWPTTKKSFVSKLFANNKKPLADMAETRKLVSQALDARMQANIKVRQPLAKLTLEITGPKLGQEYLDLIKDRVNVKEIIYGGRNELDTVIPLDLKEEGIVREIIRFVQDLRKKQGLTPRDKISLSISANDAGKSIVVNPEWQKMIMETVLAEKINLGVDVEGEKLAVEGIEFGIKLT